MVESTYFPRRSWLFSIAIGALLLSALPYLVLGVTQLSVFPGAAMSAPVQPTQIFLWYLTFVLLILALTGYVLDCPAAIITHAAALFFQLYASHVVAQMMVPGSSVRFRFVSPEVIFGYLNPVSFLLSPVLSATAFSLVAFMLVRWFAQNREARIE